MTGITFTLDQEYRLVIGSFIDRTTLESDPDNYVKNFPYGDVRCTWTVEQTLLVKTGIVTRPALDYTSRQIGRISDVWTFALWNDAMYAYLLTESGGDYDPQVTIMTIHRPEPAIFGSFQKLLALWGRMHIPRPDELTPLGNNLYQTPRLTFNDCIRADLT